MLESLFNKVVGLQPCRFTEKRLQHRCFPVHIANFLTTSANNICFFVLKNICKRVLLINLLLNNLFVFGCLFTIIKKNFHGEENGSSLIYNTSARHEQHECDTSETWATRVRHKCDTSATRTTRVLHERREWKILI